MRELFARATPLGEVAYPCQGMATTNNALFLRQWQEIDNSRIGFGLDSESIAAASGKKWFPYNKGGDYRRWYGNNCFVINFENNGKAICDYIDNTPGAKVGSNGRVINRDKYFRESITWSFVSSSYFGVRASDKGFIFDIGGSSAFPSEKNRHLVAGFLCSKVAFEYMKALNPTLNFQAGNVAALPFLRESLEAVQDRINACVTELIQIARYDWNLSETSWEFQSLPVVEFKAGTLGQSQELADSDCLSRLARMKELEDENNRLIIEAYGLQNEISPEVEHDQITLYRPDREGDIKQLLSYAIGCMLGRYSLDKPGLIYAHNGNQGFDASQYKTFHADEDGILPLTEFNWFPDDAAGRFEKFIAIAWPAVHLDENLSFVAESLGPKKGESPRETIRHYLASDFYKHHLSMYKKRPIYWLFSSGKQRGFQALVYLHRYNEGTLARMRTEYVIPLLGKMVARIDHLTDDITAASSSQHRKRLETEKATIIKQRAEVQAFDEKLRHCADQRIKLDLDDGVKVNYGKFGDLLADVKAVCGKDEEAD